jgi:hypothetical protein
MERSYSEVRTTKRDERGVVFKLDLMFAE